MAPSFRISRQLILDAAQSAGVRGELRKKAEDKAGRVRSLGASEGVNMNPRVVSGTRPKGRPYSRVESEQVGQEWGDRYTKRRRIMGRAAQGS